MAQSTRSAFCQRLLRQPLSTSRSNVHQFRSAERHGLHARSVHTPCGNHDRRIEASHWTLGDSRQYLSSRSAASSSTRTFPRLPVRTFTSSPARSHGDLIPPKPGEERHVTFIDKEGQEHTFEVADGDNLLDIAQANDLEMEGACGGSCACSTCHVIVQDDGFYDKMEEPSDDENDMLDLAFGLTETSRLGCQVKMSKELDGLVVSWGYNANKYQKLPADEFVQVKLPSMTRNMQASDFAEKK